jgi:hypothetical protein
MAASMKAGEARLARFDWPLRMCSLPRWRYYRDDVAQRRLRCLAQTEHSRWNNDAA